VTKILLTGASGIIGSVLRPALLSRYRSVRLFDLNPVVDPMPGEEFVSGDVSNLDQIVAASKGVDCMLHFAGIPKEAAWEHILMTNIVGTYNAFEAARICGVRRVVFASSNHVVGFHRGDKDIGLDAEPRPDSRYGVSKVFGEGVARLYADKHGLEVVSLRFGSVRARPEDRRQIATWISYPDTIALVHSAIDTPGVHYSVAYGVSGNSRSRWSNVGSELIGYNPRDNAEDFVEEVFAHVGELDPVSRAFHGGPFCAEEFNGDPKQID
jgi:uronate dehydrogenase